MLRSTDAWPQRRPELLGEVYRENLVGDKLLLSISIQDVQGREEVLKSLL